MSIKNTFREIALMISSKQPQMVDQILEEAPILEMIPYSPTTDGFQHNYEEIEEVTGAGIVDIDEALPEVDSHTSLKHVDLSILGGTMFVGEDKAIKMGGPQTYFARKQPLIMTKTGMDAEKTILYNNIRAYAIENDSGLTGSHVIDAGGTGTDNYSILAIKWSEGQTSGLYDPTGLGRGTLMDIQPLNGGSTFLKDSRIVYGIRMKSYFGMLLANSRYVSSIVNIDLDQSSTTPTGANIDSLIETVRGQTGGNTWLYMHPKVFTALFKNKADNLEIRIGDMDINRTFAAWNGIPILTSYNFLEGTETRVT